MVVMVELAGHVLLQVVADTAGVPAAAGEQVLQSVRGGVAGPLGELPPVLAADRSEQAAYVVPHPPAGSDPGEAAPGPQDKETARGDLAVNVIEC